MWLIYRNGLFVEGLVAVYNAGQRRGKKQQTEGKPPFKTHIVPTLQWRVKAPKSLA